MAKQLDLKALLESKMGNIEPEESSKMAVEQAEVSIPKNLMFDAESTEFKPETKPISATVARGLTVEEAKQFDDEMNRFIDSVLIAGVDYGLIPSCKKPTLLKSGAEKILNYLNLFFNDFLNINSIFRNYLHEIYSRNIVFNINKVSV